MRGGAQPHRRDEDARDQGRHWAETRGGGARRCAGASGAITGMNKNYRQSQIVKLIRGRGLHTQDELARALRALKIPATQVTLSRDIRELGLVKTPAGYAQVNAEAGAAGPDVAALGREAQLHVLPAQNLLGL